jgi:acyl-CoA oxidase
MFTFVLRSSFFVLLQGVYSQPPKAQLAYGALLGGRVSLILNCNDQLKRGLTVAIRYCAVRRQFANKPGAPETQILDYQTHQIRLLEPLWYHHLLLSHGPGRNSPVGVHGSGAFAWTFAGRTMEAQATKLQQDLANGDLTNLPDLHATSAGLKAICTWYITAALEQARQCMAGHGYSAYSALPTLVADITVNCTWEGDNTVMLLQTAQVRFLPTRLRVLFFLLTCVCCAMCVVCRALQFR